MTKRDQNGQIKHSILGKPVEVNPEKEAISNVERIIKAM
jgi:hypothetical protein